LRCGGAVAVLFLVRLLDVMGRLLALGSLALRWAAAWAVAAL